jgi:hypothetical protein
LDVIAGAVLLLKKQHPCGGQTFTVLRAGPQPRLRCDVCGHEIDFDRQKLEKQIRQALPPKEDQPE